MCFCTGSFVLIGEVILYLIRHFFCHIFMMEKFEDGLCLFHVDTEELTVLVDALRIKSFMKGFLNFKAITFLDLARKLTLKRNGDSCGIKLLHPFVNVFLCSHANFYKPWHHWVCQKIYYSVFHIVVFLETIVKFVLAYNEIEKLRILSLIELSFYIAARVLWKAISHLFFIAVVGKYI